MTDNLIEELGTNIDDGFFLIGAALLIIEIIKALFEKPISGRRFLDMVASIFTQIPSILIETFILAFAYIGYVWVAQNYVSWEMPANVWVLLLAVLVCDFVYYWEHRFSHEIRLLWTQHAVHHSSRFMNITVALRFGPLEGVASAVLHFPLVLMGFPPEMVFFGILVVLAYQTWIHTELIGKLGVLEEVLNTPANHRVHHGCDDKYIDKNYGGILIIWDRLFGTFQREEETPQYGLKRDFNSVNPLYVLVSEIPQLAKDVANANSFGEAWNYLVKPPGWKPEHK